MSVMWVNASGTAAVEDVEELFERVKTFMWSVLECDIERLSTEKLQTLDNELQQPKYEQHITMLWKGYRSDTDSYGT
ncbi:hypothetical protein DVH05_008746 [Phytophthora capsici]|nr:hypothetical protein DVH05_008746 [Phytophthora capsici]